MLIIILIIQHRNHLILVLLVLKKNHFILQLHDYVYAPKYKLVHTKYRFYKHYYLFKYLIQETNMLVVNL